jgi:hypothetical protein
VGVGAQLPNRNPAAQQPDQPRRITHQCILERTDDGVPWILRTLARISHRTPTAAADSRVSAALLLLVLLDVPSSTTAGAFVARLASTRLSTTSLRTPVRKAG